MGCSTLGGGGVCPPWGDTGVEAGGGFMVEGLLVWGRVDLGITWGLYLGVPGMLLCVSPPPPRSVCPPCLSFPREWEQNRAGLGREPLGFSSPSRLSLFPPIPSSAGGKLGGFAGAGGGSRTLTEPGTHPGPLSLPASGISVGREVFAWVANSFLIREAGRDGE